MATVHNTTIYPHPPQGRYAEAAEMLRALAGKYRAEAFAIGDGTAGRETEQLVRGLGLDGAVEIFMVSEDGASVYSASDAAREVSRLRRDDARLGEHRPEADRPARSWRKIDPKSIGVGQYQHSVDQGKLKARLNTVVESCVNRVGVNINTASKHILTYISGLGPALAENIVAYLRRERRFQEPQRIAQVPRLGAKAERSAAGFLRIVGAGRIPLDNSAVHPESYHSRADGRRRGRDGRQAARRQGAAQGHQTREIRGRTGRSPTVTDIVEALDKCGLDPREQLQAFSFDPNVRTIGDLREGMTLPGIVTNITAFGAFVDIGIKQDGLVHISQMADRYVASPAEVVHLGQQVEVRVTVIDTARGRISLSMRK